MKKLIYSLILGPDGGDGGHGGHVMFSADNKVSNLWYLVQNHFILVVEWQQSLKICFFRSQLSVVYIISVYNIRWIALCL